MIRDHSDLPVNACLLKIGLEVIPVYGNERSGWTVEDGVSQFPTPRRFRYRTLEELYFALVTMTVNSEGEA